MFVDRDGDHWCYDERCYAIARERLSSPRSTYRLRREVARLEYEYARPADPIELFALPSAADIFGITDDAPAMETGHGSAYASSPVLAEQLSLLDPQEEAA